MKKIALLLTGMLFFASLPIFAQTGQIILQVDWIPKKFLIIEDDFLKTTPMSVYVDGSEVFILKYKESKEITLPSGNHTIFLRYGNNLQTDTISFNVHSGRVVFRFTPSLPPFGMGNYELVQVSPSSQPQSVAQQPQTNNNQPRTNSGTTNQTSNSQSTNTRQSLGNLRNTTWVAYSYGSIGFFYEGTETIDFGNGNYRYTLQGSLNGFPTSSTETGTYTVSGDNVIFTSNGEKTIIGGSDGKQTTGSIIGNSLTVGGSTYRRQ
jgi:hypothetical protein